MSNNDKQRPAARHRIGSVTGSIWENVTDKGKFYNVTFGRGYKAADGWKSTRSFGVDDLLQLAKLADVLHTTISRMVAEDRQGAPADEDGALVAAE